MTLEEVKKGETHPSAVAEIADGWFVKTHSGTAAKISYIKRIAKALRVKLVVAKV